MTSHEYKYISYRDFTDNSGYIWWNWWLKSMSHKIDVIIIFQISISGLFVDILQVQMSNRIIDIYLSHQYDVISVTSSGYIHQWLGSFYCQTARWEVNLSTWHYRRHSSDGLVALGILSVLGHLRSFKVR